MPESSATGGNLFSGVPGTLPEELFETLLERPGCRLERIVSRGHATPPGQWYDQREEEWVLLVKGAAALEIEGEGGVRELGPGDYLLLPAHCRHRVAWTSAGEETVWLALNLTAESQ
jgi:cupin 2 domain-containing protein